MAEVNYRSLFSSLVISFWKTSRTRMQKDLTDSCLAANHNAGQTNKLR
jgi:hypothetical protein